MNAEIIQPIPGARADDGQTDFPTIAFRSVVPDRAMDHADVAPYEHAGPNGRET